MIESMQEDYDIYETFPLDGSLNLRTILLEKCIKIPISYFKHQLSLNFWLLTTC